MLIRNLMLRAPESISIGSLLAPARTCSSKSFNISSQLCVHYPRISRPLPRTQFQGRFALSQFRSLHTSYRLPKDSEKPNEKPEENRDSDARRGSLISTKSHLFRLTLPLPSTYPDSTSKPLKESKDQSSSTSTNEVSFLLHPSQPLSQLSSLIIAELPHRPHSGGQQQLVTFHGFQNPDPSVKGDEEEGVRWSQGTELGEFMRDAAKVREFRIRLNLEEEEGWEIVVRVPNFEDRTRYMREKFHSIMKEINDLAKIKFECDKIAHQHSKHVALGGFGVLVVYWGSIYYLTFQKYGWDVMEPVTYLTGLGTAMLGYLWFLYHNRDVSYRSVLQQTTTHRQRTLYQQRGFDEDQWHELVQDGKRLGKEIRSIGEEYGVKWNPKAEATGRAEGILEKEEKKDKKVKKMKEKAKEEDEDDD